jgi:hypothetical protein
MLNRIFSAGGVKIEKRADGKKQITGYAAVWFRPGDAATEFKLAENTVERVFPGAFSRAIESGDCLGTFNHDPSLLLGRTGAGTMRLEEDGTGLKYTIDPPDTQAARDLIVSMERGDVAGSSFSFTPDKVTWSNENGRAIRELRSVRLHDCGPVSKPAYAASSASLRAEDLAALQAEYRAATGADTAPSPAVSTGRNLPAHLAAVRARVVEVEARLHGIGPNVRCYGEPMRDRPPSGIGSMLALAATFVETEEDPKDVAVMVTVMEQLVSLLKVEATDDQGMASRAKRVIAEARDYCDECDPDEDDECALECDLEGRGGKGGGFEHNSKTSDDEPAWADVDKAKLPDAAFAGEKDRSYPHHHIVDGGKPDDAGQFTTGTMLLSKSGLNAAWAAAQGAHTGEKASQEIIDHLAAHRKALGIDD